MASPDCGLPNVDIFDPVQCTKRWNQCASQQQINVYLNSEIVRTQECLQLFKTAQHGVNDILDGKIRNHETRITTLEAAQETLTNAQNKLNADFAVIQAQNTAYQTSVDNTLKLYQESINAITTTTNTLATEQQKLWNEINALKGSIDVSKINEALAGYDAIMTQTKELIAANNAELNIQFKSLETKFNTLESDVNNSLSDSEAALSKRFNTLSKTVSADIEAQNTRINNLVNSTSASIADLQAQISSGNNDVAKSIAAMQQDIKDLHTELKEGDAALGERIAAEEQARKDGDECLKGQIKASDAINAAALATLESKVVGDIDALDKKVTDEISTFETNTDLKILQIQNDLRNSQDAAITALDSKLSAEIKSVESDLSKQITELTYSNAAEHKAINERIDGLETELADGVDERISDAITIVNTRITNVESNAQNANDALELRLTKTITDGLAESSSDLAELTKRVDTQGELIQASRDEATLAWQTEIKDRIAGDEALKAEIAALDIEGVKAQIKDEVESATAPIQADIAATNEEIEKLKVSDGKQWTTINNTVESSNQLGERVTRLENMGGSGYDDSEVKALIEVNRLEIAKAEKEIGDIQEATKLSDAKIDALEISNDNNAKAIKIVDEKRIAEHAAIDARVTVLEEAGSGEGYDDTELKARVETNETDIANLKTAIGSVEESDFVKVCYDIHTLALGRTVYNHALKTGQTLTFIDRQLNGKDQKVECYARITAQRNGTESVEFMISQTEEFCGYINGTEKTSMLEGAGTISGSATRASGDSSVFNGTIFNKVSANYSMSFTAFVTSDGNLLVHMIVNTEYMARDIQSPNVALPETKALRYDGSQTYDGTQLHNGKVKE